MKISKNQPTVSFQGTHYAFSEIAARKYFGQEIETLPCRQFKDVFTAVESEKSDFGIIPIENSLTGSIYQNLDLLLESTVSIAGETSIRVEQHLITCPGISLKDIRVVYSHPQALQQCREFLSSLKNVEIIASYDTAGSVKDIRDRQMLQAAAIASRQAANDYGMEIIREEIEDIPENYTRFYIISKDALTLNNADKTSIIFSIKNLPGALFKSLSVFALRDIDLLKIESRPLRGRPWEYFFYLDFAGNIEEERCRNAIRHLEEITDFLKVLGSYKSAAKH
jgi:prephenate dehydratase